MRVVIYLIIVSILGAGSLVKAIRCFTKLPVPKMETMIPDLENDVSARTKEQGSLRSQQMFLPQTNRNLVLFFTLVSLCMLSKSHDPRCLAAWVINLMGFC